MRIYVVNYSNISGWMLKIERLADRRRTGTRAGVWEKASAAAWSATGGAGIALLEQVTVGTDTHVWRGDPNALLEKRSGHHESSLHVVIGNVLSATRSAAVKAA